jgi:glutaredoxin
MIQRVDRNHDGRLSFPEFVEMMLNEALQSSVVVYTSEVSSDVLSKKNFRSVIHLLKANEIPFTVVDVSLDENAELKAKMTATSGQRKLPQVFVKGVFCGLFEDLEAANEVGQLKEFLVAKGL